MYINNIYIYFNMILAYVLTTFIFLLYIQFSPKMGNIWYRNGYFVPRGAINLIIYPFREIKMWSPKLWDINYFMWIIITFGIMKLYIYFEF